MKRLSILLVVAAVLLPARADASNWRAALKNARRTAAAVLERSLDRIQATPQQRKQLRQIAARSATEAWALRGEALALQDRVAAAVLAADHDPAELDRLEQESVDLLGRGARAARGGLIEAAGVLTPEQRAELLRMWRRWVRQAAGT